MNITQHRLRGARAGGRTTAERWQELERIEAQRQSHANGQADIEPPPVGYPIDPHAASVTPLIRSALRSNSNADNQANPPRQGSQAALACPSRVGDKLHWRDGRVTDLNGNFPVYPVP